MRKHTRFWKRGILILCMFVTTGCTRVGEPEKQLSTDSIVSVPLEETVELSIYFSGEDVKWVSTVQELGEDFMREYPGIKLNINHSGEGIYTENLKVREAVNDFPDVFEIQNPNTFVKAGKVGAMPEEIVELVEVPTIIDGQYYAVPLYSTTYGIIYNQIIFKQYGIEVPKTYSQFLEVCKKLKAKGVTPLGLGGSKADNVGYWLSYFYQTEVVAATPDWQQQKLSGQADFTKPDGMRMLNQYQELMKSQYIMEDSINMKDHQLVRNFVDGQVAMIYAGPWLFPQIIDAYPLAGESDKDSRGEELDEDPAICRLAWFFMPDEEENAIALNKIGASWAISKECEVDELKRNAAVTFFQYFFQRVHYQKILQTMYAIPTTKEAVLYASPGVQQRLLTDYRYATKSTEYFSNSLTPDGFETALQDVLKSVSTDVMSVKSAAKKLDEVWDELKE